MHSTISQRRRP